MFLAPWSRSRSRLKKKQEPEPIGKKGWARTLAAWKKSQETDPQKITHAQNQKGRRTYERTDEHFYIIRYKERVCIAYIYILYEVYNMYILHTYICITYRVYIYIYIKEIIYSTHLSYNVQLYINMNVLFR